MNKLHLSVKILLYGLVVLLLGIIFFFHDSKLALAATDVTGVGTGTLELSGTGNGSLTFYRGTGGEATTYGDHNCSQGANCSWSSTASSGFGYGTSLDEFYFIDGVNGSECSSLGYFACLSAGAEVGCYVTDGSTWEVCTVPTGGGGGTATTTPYNDPVQNIFFGWIVFSLTAWGVISFFNKKYG